MGSNKRHKTEKQQVRDTKKKRHRGSRSRSYSPEQRDKTDKHRHHKKHKRKERKDCDSDVEIISAPPPPKIFRGSRLQTPPPPPEISKARRDDESPPKGGSSQVSLSVEETNKLRAKLGLKPLRVEATEAKGDPNKIKDDLGEFYHEPAINANETLKIEKIKEKLQVRRRQRRIESNLAKVKSLGEERDVDGDSDDDAVAWVEKNRRLDDEKRKADERAKMLDRLDEEFGIGNLVKEDEEIERRTAYTERDLRGLRVEHDAENFAQGQTLILTLKDKGVLDEEKDVLVNVNMKDDERYKLNIVRKSKKAGYDAYDEENFDEFGLPRNTVLEKYDEEIEGEKKRSFALGVESSAVNESRHNRRTEIIKHRLANKRLESLKLAEPKLASEYYNEEELAKFKKPRKKLRKIRGKKRMLKADDLVAESTDYLTDLGSRRSRKPTETKPRRDEPADDLTDVDDYEAPTEDLTGVKIEDDDKELEFQLALRKAQRLKKPLLTPPPPPQPQPPQQQQQQTSIKRENDTLDDNQSGNIILNATAEFCRTLGDIPTYGLAGNREENDQEIMDFEVDGAEEEAALDGEEGDGRGAWNSVQLEKATIEPVAMEAAILDAEPSLGQGVGGALRLAMSKGYLQKEDTNRPSASRFAHLQAQNYSIEDKTYGDDDKFGRRDRFNGPTSDFKERDGFKPNVKLEYIDDDGHVLCAKEAFRYLSHKFHGKGPGKNKVEKRMKKAEQEVLMKRMSSTDTPLGTLNLLQAKQKETQSPYIVLSGSKQMQSTTISKSKH